MFLQLYEVILQLLAVYRATVDLDFVNIILGGAKICFW